MIESRGTSSKPSEQAFRKRLVLFVLLPLALRTAFAQTLVQKANEEIKPTGKSLAVLENVS